MPGLHRVIDLLRRVDSRWHRRRHPASRTLLINARTEMNCAVVAPILQALRHDGRVHVYLMASESPNRAREIYREAPNGRIISPARAAMMKFDAYLTADAIWPSLPRGASRILMFHGVAGKYADQYDRPAQSMRAWQRLFFINRRRLNNHVAAGAIEADSPAARLIGMPKLDALVNGSLTRGQVMLSLGLDPSRRTVLYAPTWSPYSSLNICGDTMVQRLVEAGYAVIVKLHDRSRDLQFIHSGGVDWAARLTPLLANGNGHFFRGADASPCLAAADLLITDHSSVGFEYLLLDRPVIRIEVPELLHKTRVAAEYVELLRCASTTVTPESDIVRAVESSLLEPHRQSSSRLAVASELFYQPGTATARAVRELYEVLDLEPAPLASGLDGTAAPARMTARV
jgi:hypothetical protein